jgi:hypothetical protein
VNLVQKLADLYTERPVSHTLQGVKDYIDKPKPDGYRGIHMMYRFNGHNQSEPWNKLRVEIQLRTRLQHSWATAVETVDTFIGERLKTGAGSDDWVRFFQLAGSAHAILEKQPIVPGTPSDTKDIKDELLYLETKLKVFATLGSWAHMRQHFEGLKGGKDYWYVVSINPDTRKVEVQSFAAEDRINATTRYAELEKEYKNSKTNVVMVAAHSLKTLQKAYPNYFADTIEFMTSVVNFLKAAQSS